MREQRIRNYLGRMTDEEYRAMWEGGDNILKERPVRFLGSLGRLTDEEYRNLPYGNRGFHEQFNNNKKKG